jgi:hypothetical protein
LARRQVEVFVFLKLTNVCFLAYDAHVSKQKYAFEGGLPWIFFAKPEKKRI